MTKIARTCASCDDAIDPRRLQRLPNARFCVSCLELGLGVEQFAYKAMSMIDDAGNFHTEIIRSQDAWKALNDGINDDAVVSVKPQCQQCIERVIAHDYDDEVNSNE